jgi:branched-chain amino acid transport system ATP-binding protein
MALLETKDLTKQFGGLAAIDQVNIEANCGEILGLIGPNGAGKTTLFNLITGSLRPSYGKIFFKGEDITGLKPNQIAEKGIVRTFQASTLFDKRTVMENVLIGCHLQFHTGLLRVLFNTSRTRSEEKEIRQRALEIIEMTGLSPVRDELAGSLPHGHQRVLGICIALAANPELLLLDEPVAGSNPEESVRLMSLVKKLRDRGITIILVEHDMKAVMHTCDRIVVLNCGKKMAEGNPEEIRENRDVIEAYLGVEEDAA